MALTSDLLCKSIIAQTAVYCNEKGVNLHLKTRIDRPNQTAIRFLLFRIPTIRNSQLGMFAVLRIVNIIYH